jgi:hypothetical protein
VSARRTSTRDHGWDWADLRQWPWLPETTSSAWPDVRSGWPRRAWTLICGEGEPEDHPNAAAFTATTLALYYVRLNVFCASGSKYFLFKLH